MNTWSVEFDELADNTSLPEHLDAGQDEISGSSVLWKASSESEADNLWEDHGNGLTQHNGLGFNTADTPSNNTETIDHGGVRIGTNNRIVVKKSISLEDDSGEIFKVDLMDNTGAWWHDLEVVEGFGSPL